MTLHEKIAYYRRDKRLSQEDLAAQVGVSRQAVSKWELGEASPDVGKLLSLARAFGVTTDHLLNDAEEPRRDMPKAPENTPKPSQSPNLPGFLGRMVCRWGWLAGIYIALQGAGMALAGTIARWGFRSMFAPANLLIGVDGGFGGTSWLYDGSSELEGAVMDALDVAPQVTPFSGVQGFFLGVANLILVLGILVVIAGLTLAYILWKRGKSRD